MTCPEKDKNSAEMLGERPLPEVLRQHIAGCADCAGEQAAMEKTWKLLDEWQAPDPSDFFDARLYARLREEQTIAPASFLERAKAWLLYSSNLHMRQLTAGALATVLVICGGTFAVIGYQGTPAPQASATVGDLQSFDRNAQLFQQLNALDGDEDSTSN